VLVRPLPVRVLLKTTLQDNEIAQALLAKENPVLEQRLDAVFHQGKNEGMDVAAQSMKAAIQVIADLVCITLEDSHQKQLEQCSLSKLEALLKYLKKHRTWPPPSYFEESL
jgi:hypothetical protein